MATGGRLRYWVSSCFVLIAFHVLFLELIGGKKPHKQIQPFLYLEGAYVQPVHWPASNVSIQRCWCAVFTPNGPCPKSFGSKDFIPSFSSLRTEAEREVS